VRENYFYAKTTAVSPVDAVYRPRPQSISIVLYRRSTGHAQKREQDRHRDHHRPSGKDQSAGK
jgi:hypothetical protein